MKTRQLLSPKLLIIILFGLACEAFGQDLVFNKLITSGNSNSAFVFAFSQDKNGTIWIAKQDGVYGYDGQNITTLRTIPLNPNSLANNFAHSICADNNGQIWIGTFGSGLDMYNPDTEIFTHFKNDINNPNSLVNDTVVALLIDTEGTLWIGTHGGLDKFNAESNSFVHYKYDARDSASISSNLVRVLYEDKEGTLWIGTGSPWLNDGNGPDDQGGLNKMNKETGTFTRYLHDPTNSNSLFNNKVSAIFEDMTGTLWIGTMNKGIQKMNTEQGTFVPAFSELERPPFHTIGDLSSVGLDDDYISFITQDAAGKIWFGTYVSGNYCYDPENKKTSCFNGVENTSSGFSDNGSRTAFNSRDGILFIGTKEGNIFFTDPSSKKIQHTSVSGSKVGSFYEEPNGDFWIGTMNEIIRNISNTGEVKRYFTTDYNINAQNNGGYRIQGDSEGNIWVLTTESLNRFDKKTGKFIAYKNDPDNNSSISASYIITTYEDSKSNFWIGTANGLNLMDRRNGTFTRFYANQAHLEWGSQNVILSITEDQSGNLWLGNWNGMGVNRFNPESKEFKYYLNAATVWNLLQDKDGVLWAGSDQGLFKYDPKNDEFVPFAIGGLEVNITEVRNLLEDNQKNLWLTTSNNMIKINADRNEISFFGQNYGVGQNTFSYKSAYKKSNGEIYFGDATGYFSFFPSELISNLKTPELVFKRFYLSDKILTPDDGRPLHDYLNEQKAIKLQYNQNVFSIDFVIVDYANPAQNDLTYYLENYDVSWREANSDRRAYYFNVPPGKYKFRLKGVNSYGAWAEKTVDIVIKPPWWRSWLAYTIYALLLIAAIFAFDRIMRRRIVQKERRKTQERELAQAKEIEKAYKELKATQAQLIQSEKMASLGELTAGIAHEIQNPLNFVNNFSEVNKELLEEMNEEIENGNLEEVKLLAKDVIDNETKINYHGKRADAIVKGMLQHSRSSGGVKEPTDINELADEYLRLAYHGLRAKDKSFNAIMKTDFDKNIGNINVVTQDIGRVILNLITNAFYVVHEKKKLLGEGYEPTVSVKTKNFKNKVEVSVADNANGIPQKVLDKIFQPFFTTKPTGQGTGLGLSLSYDIVKAHGGEIKVESVEGEGTVFTIILPL